MLRSRRTRRARCSSLRGSMRTGCRSGSRTADQGCARRTYRGSSSAAGRPRTAPMHHPGGSGAGSGWRWSPRRSAATVAPSPCSPVPARSSRCRCCCERRWTRRRDRMPAVIRVLVVEDEPVAAEAHRTYVDRTPGFATAAVAATGALALDALARTPVDLVLLDMNLPDTHGIELCRRIRAAGADVDVLAVTSARELTVVRAAAAHGVVGYLLSRSPTRRCATGWWPTPTTGTGCR